MSEPNAERIAAALVRALDDDGYLDPHMDARAFEGAAAKIAPDIRAALDAKDREIAGLPEITDPARSIAAMLAKFSDEDRAAFNLCAKTAIASERRRSEALLAALAEARRERDALVRGITDLLHEISGDDYLAGSSLPLPALAAVVKRQVAALAEARAKFEKRLWHSQNFWSVRVERLSQWVREADLPESFVAQYFSIVANGTLNSLENPTYEQTLNIERYRAEYAEKERDEARRELEDAIFAAEWAMAKLDRGDGVLEYTGTIAEGDEAKRRLDRALAALGRPAPDGEPHSAT